MVKMGVFLARMQPLHNAHMWLIEKALEECERVTIILGSSNKKGMLRNPFTLEFRKYLLQNALENETDMSRITIFELPDWGLENDTQDPIIWGRYLYYNIVGRTEEKHFNMYYSDSPETIEGWFNSEIKEFINLRLFDRSNTLDGLSATKIRGAIASGNVDYIAKYCPQIVVDNMREIIGDYNSVLESPKSDFRM